MRVGSKTTEPTTLHLEINDNKKSFKIGEKFNFSSYETYEMTFSLDIITRELIGLVKQNYKK